MAYQHSFLAAVKPVPVDETLSGCLKRGETELSRLLTERLSASPRSTIARAGERRLMIGRIRSGWAVRMRYLVDGQACGNVVLLPGDTFGAEAALFGRQPDDVVALTACEVDYRDRDTLYDSMAGTEIMTRLMWQLCEEAQRLRQAVTALSRGTAEQRVALLILELHARLLDGMDGARDQTVIPWPLTQQCMADLLGLTAVHVNRVLKRLREQDAVHIEGGKARLNPPTLASMAAPLLDGAGRTARRQAELHLPLR